MIITNTGQSRLSSNEIVHGKRAVTAATALRLARYFGTSEAFWMGLQADSVKCAAAQPENA